MWQLLFQLRECETRAARDCEDVLVGNVKLGIATHVHNRWQNAVTAILWNCCMCWTYRHCVVITAVGFGTTDAEPLRFLQWAAHAALEEGLLVLASGGETGIAARDHPTSFGPYRFSCTPTDLDGRGGDPSERPPAEECFPPTLRFWHASWAKNTSHLAATWAMHRLKRWEAEQQLLCNVDGDNLIFPKWLCIVASSHTTTATPRGHVTQAGRANCAGCTGRLTYRMKDFWHVGGYDVDSMYGMGYQDIDLRERLRRLPQDPPEGCSVSPSITPAAPQPIGWVDHFSSVGAALPNDTDSKKDDRGAAKIKNCALSTKSDGRLMTWSDMNEANKRLCSTRLSKNLLIRNTEVPFKNCWFTFLGHNEVAAEADWEGTENFSEPALRETLEKLRLAGTATKPLHEPGQGLMAANESVEQDSRLTVDYTWQSWEEQEAALKQAKEPKPKRKPQRPREIVTDTVAPLRWQTTSERSASSSMATGEALPPVIAAAAPPSTTMSSCSSRDITPNVFTLREGETPKRVYIQVMGLCTAYCVADTQNTCASQFFLLTALSEPKIF